MTMLHNSFRSYYMSSNGIKAVYALSQCIVSGTRYYYSHFVEEKSSERFQDFLWSHSLDRAEPQVLSTFNQTGMYFLLLCILQVISKVIFSYNMWCFPGESTFEGQRRGQVWQRALSYGSRALPKAFWSEQLANSYARCAMWVVNFNR